jgi:hypothetical protein
MRYWIYTEAVGKIEGKNGIFYHDLSTSKNDLFTKGESH